MSKIDEAKTKLATECQSKDYLIPFEEHLTDICTTESIAEKILQEGKTLQGCFDKMRNVAKNRQKNNCAYIPPEEGFKIIEEYFDINPNNNETFGSVIDITDLL